MKNLYILPLSVLVSAVFLLWKWNAYQRIEKTDAANMAKDWANVGGDIRGAMYRYNKKL